MLYHVGTLLVKHDFIISCSRRTNEKTIVKTNVFCFKQNNFKKTIKSF